MINRAELKNFGPIKALDWQNLGKINLIIGNNGCGKSFLLKALYSAVRTIEEYKRGDNPDTITDILRSKLYWTFQPEKISYLVTNPSDADLLFKLTTFDQQSFSYSFGKDSVKTQSFISVDNQVPLRADNSIFLPAKEVLSLHHIILKSREQDKLYGFDDTYLDLAKALNQIPLPSIQEISWDNSVAVYDNSSYSSTRGKNYFDFNNSRLILESIIGGIIEFDDVSKRWYFKKGEQRFSMGITAEGIKKIAILDTLLGNGYLNEKSIIFFDEPESALHPEAIAKLLDIIIILANYGIQFFLASHSYFVIKKLFLIAQEQQTPIPVLSYQDDEWVQSDLKEDLPDNPIIDESIRLYKEEMFMAAR